jgi:hypothetical protein
MSRALVTSSDTCRIDLHAAPTSVTPSQHNTNNANRCATASKQPTNELTNQTRDGYET